MRRYGSLKYGSTLYGLGTVDVYAAVTVTFSEDLRYTTTVKVQFIDNATFSERFDIAVLRDVRVADNIVFDLDIRLKYVVTRMTDTIQFNLDTNTSMFAEQFAFDALISYPIVLKSVYMNDLIEFGNSLHARRLWEEVSNPLDEIWTPRPHDGDTWTPRVNPLDEIWTKRNSVGEYWVERTSPADFWTPFYERAARVTVKAPVPVASVTTKVTVYAAVAAIAPKTIAASTVSGSLAWAAVAAIAPKPTAVAAVGVELAVIVTALSPRPLAAVGTSVGVSAAVTTVTPIPAAATTVTVVGAAVSAAVAAVTSKPTAAANAAVGVSAAVASSAGAVAASATVGVASAVDISVAATAAPAVAAATTSVTSVTVVTWNPLDKHANIVLANSDLTAATTSGSVRSVRATKFVADATNGKYYLEFVWGGNASVSTSVGIASSALVLDQYRGTTAVILRPATTVAAAVATLNINGTTNVTPAGSPTIAAGDIIGMGVDTAANRVYFSINGTFIDSANPAAGTGGRAFSALDYAAFTARTGGAGGVTIRSTVAEFSYPVPSGFIPYASA